MVKHTQTICRKQPTNCLSVFDHFVKLVLEGLRVFSAPYIPILGQNLLLFSTYSGIFESEKTHGIFLGVVFSMYVYHNDNNKCV